MSPVQRTIVPSPNRCDTCGTQLLVTQDAIGRPRERCPQCQGVVREPMEAGVVAPLHRQTATCMAELAWDLTPAKVLSTVRGQRRCVDCGTALPSQATGRPRLRCGHRVGCLERQRGVA